MDNENAVTHPSHYTDGGNAVKYISRAGKKDPDKEIEDLEKAVWYLQREIEKIKGKGEVSNGTVL